MLCRIAEFGSLSTVKFIHFSDIMELSIIVYGFSIPEFKIVCFESGINILNKAADTPM